jgi:hypothetical protein
MFGLRKTLRLSSQFPPHHFSAHSVKDIRSPYTPPLSLPPTPPCCPCLPPAALAHHLLPSLTTCYPRLPPACHRCPCLPPSLLPSACHQLLPLLASCCPCSPPASLPLLATCCPALACDLLLPSLATCPQLATCCGCPRSPPAALLPPAPLPLLTTCCCPCLQPAAAISLPPAAALACHLLPSALSSRATQASSCPLP